MKSAVTNSKRSITVKGFVINPNVFTANSRSVPLKTPIESSDLRSESNDDLFVPLRGILILGRILGVIPLSGVLGQSHKSLRFKYCSFAGLSSLCCIILLVINLALAIADSVRSSKQNALDIARAIQSPLFSSWGLFIYTYFFLRTSEFLDIFKHWSKLNISYHIKDTSLYRTIVLASVIIFSSTVLENGVLHLEFFEAFDDINGHNAKYGKETGNASVITMYYYRSNPGWNRTLGYHPIFAILCFFIHKWVLYGWNYIDVLTALFCRGLYFKFKALHKLANENLFQPVPLQSLDEYSLTDADRQAWVQLANDHERLCDLIDTFNKFFSPVLFLSYTINIYFVCMQLLSGLNPAFVNNSIVHSIYAPWSFVHIIARVFLLSVCAARVNEYAHDIRDVVQRCPAELFHGPIAKLDKRVNLGPNLGLTGLGCFVITKPFMLSILNVVFTVEIVLLQGLPTNTTSDNCNLTKSK